MIINEGGFTRAIKRAYSFQGYTVFRHEDYMVVYCNEWCVECAKEIFPRKAMAAIVEHAGFLPGDCEAYKIGKKEDPQVESFEMAMDTVRYWRSAESTEVAEVTAVTFCRYQLIQDTEPSEEDGKHRLHGVNPGNLEILEWPVVRGQKALIADGFRAIYSADEERVCLGLISGRAFEDDERKSAIWEQLEQADLRQRKE